MQSFCPVTPKDEGALWPREKKTFWRLTWFNLLGNLTVPLSGLVDTAVLGHLSSPLPLAGLGLGSILFDFLYLQFAFIRMTTTGLSAQCFGQKQWSDLKDLLLRSLTASWLLGVIFLISSPLILQLALRLLGGSTAVQEEAAAYFWGRILGAPFVLGNFALIGWFLGQGRAQVVFLVSALGHSVNAVLSVWMVWVMDRGVHGVGFATSVSQLLMFGLLMMVASGVVFSGASGPLDFWPRLWKCLRPSPEWMALFRVNGFAVLRSFFLLLAFSLWMDGAARLGDDFLAMQSILLRVVSLNAYFVDACAMALETMVGQNVRAHVFHLLQLLGQVLLRSFGASLVLLFPWWMWPEWCFSFLTPQQALLDQLVLWRGWLLVVGLLGSLAYGLDGFFVGLTAMKTLAISMILSFALFFLPVYLWALVAHSPVILWSALACLMMGRAVTLLTALRKSRSSGFQGIR